MSGMMEQNVQAFVVVSMKLRFNQVSIVFSCPHEDAGLK